MILKAGYAHCQLLMKDISKMRSASLRIYHSLILEFFVPCERLTRGFVKSFKLLTRNNEQVRVCNQTRFSSQPL